MGVVIEQQRLENSDLLNAAHPGHFDVIDMSNDAMMHARSARHRAAAAARRDHLRSALADPVDVLERKSITGVDLSDYSPLGSGSDETAPRPDVSHVVFLMHGIRDKGFWT